MEDKVAVNKVEETDHERVAKLEQLLRESRNEGLGSRNLATMPGLDAYVPSRVSTTTKNISEEEWETGTKY